MDFDVEQILRDTVKSVGEANVLPIGVISNLSKIGSDPAGALEGLGGLLVPSLGIAQTLPGAFSTEPNIAGAGGTPVIAAALAVLKDMREQCGNDQPPDNGDDFARGGAAFTALADVIGGADSPGSWEGSASESYSQANTAQQNRAIGIAEQDADVSAALSTEAGQVSETREAIDYAIQSLNLCIPVAMSLSLLPVGGNSASYGFQVQSVAAIMPIAAVPFERLTGEATQNAAKVAAAADGYDALALDGKSTQGGAATLHVETADLRRLSGKQTAIADNASTAGSTAIGTPASVAETHGTVCAATSSAVGKAAVARRTAAFAVQTAAEDLATGLTTAADEYDRTDAEELDSMNREMRPDG